MFFLKFSSSLDNFNFAEKLWKFFLSEQGFSEEKEYWINLAVHEIVLNAIIHGNKKNTRKWVYVLMKKNRKFFNIEVTDQGNCKKCPKVENPSKKENILKSHGRGIYIVKKSVDKLKFKILPNGNLKVIMKINMDLSQK